MLGAKCKTKDLSAPFRKDLLMSSVKKYLALFILACLASPIFGQLENASYFSPGKCFSPEANASFYTKNYYEFAKLYNAPTREKAVENFRNLFESAKTEEAKAWALFGLRSLGEPDISRKMENVRLFTGNLGIHKGNIQFNADGDIQIPEKYADIDTKDFELPSDIEAYSKNVLCRSGMYATGAIGEAGIIPAEVWAFNYLAAGKSDSEISKIAREVWNLSENFEGRLYALLLFKRAGNEAEFAKRISELNPDEEFTEMGGCIIMRRTLKKTKNIEGLFNVKYAFDRLLLKYPQCVNPRNSDINLIPMRKIEITFREAKIKEDALGYLPMRFRSKGTRFLCGEGLQKLANQWLETKDLRQKEVFENILNKHLLPNAPARFIAHYDTYESVFVEKRESGYFFVNRKPKFGDEPCFDPIFYSSTENRKFEKRVLAGSIKSTLCGSKPSDDVSFPYLFYRANKIIMESLKTDGLYKSTLAEELAKRFEPKDILGEFLILSRFGDNVSAWLCPIFKDTPTEQIELLKKQHEAILNIIDSDAKKSYDSLSKKYKTILDCNGK